VSWHAPKPGFACRSRTSGAPVKLPSGNAVKTPSLRTTQGRRGGFSMPPRTGEAVALELSALAIRPIRLPQSVVSSWKGPRGNLIPKAEGAPTSINAFAQVRFPGSRYRPMVPTHSIIGNRGQKDTLTVRMASCRFQLASCFHRIRTLVPGGHGCSPTPRPLLKWPGS
jgi:hypothetical protein